jgi:hypothetical protein
MIVAGNLFHVDITHGTNKAEIPLEAARQCCNATPCHLVLDVTSWSDANARTK